MIEYMKVLYDEMVFLFSLMICLFLLNRIIIYRYTNLFVVNTDDNRQYNKQQAQEKDSKLK